MMLKTFTLCVVIQLCYLDMSKGKTIESSPQTTSLISNSTDRSFVIDYDNDVFLKDGKPFQYISGDLHYFRVPRAYWRDRLQKFKAAGLNAVSIYVEWNTHEPSPKKYTFDGEADIEYLMQLAIEENLLVILRPGPYVNAEREFGGLPPWLLTLYPNIKLRAHDRDFENEVEKWFDQLFSKMTKYLYGNGGPIITVQVENEYGGHPACDMDYKMFVRDLLKKYIHDTAVLFTTDAPWNLTFLECGSVPGVYAGVDFEAGANVTLAFSNMRKFSPRGPLLNSEFYTGWYSCWEEHRNRRFLDTTMILNSTKELFDLKASINFYMFAGGTNFGFRNGAKFEGTPPDDMEHERYRPILTSYDWGAPLDEAGDYTPKYYAIRKFISEYYKQPLHDLPSPTPKEKYGKVRLESASSIFNTAVIVDKIVVVAEEPQTFEKLNVKYGYVLYETKVPDNVSDSAVLHVKEVRDRATIFLNQVPVGILSRRAENNTISLTAASGKKLSILIENQGRVDYGAHLKDLKGLLSTPTLDNQPLKQWTMTGLPFENISWVHDLPKPTKEIKPPALYVGELILPPNEEPKDTFVDPSGWGKGVIFINDFHIGRYWPSAGSQVTLFVPGVYLRASPQKNTIVMFETDYIPKNKEIVFTDKPILDKK